MIGCIVGKGSIGKRHGDILNKLGINVYFIRRNTKKKDEIKITNKKFLEKSNFFLITNPTSNHIYALKKLLRYKKPILIEKPLFSQILKSNEYKKFLNKKLFVAYMLRYDPRIEKLKKIVSKSKSSYSKINWQTYMPNWHPKENFKKSYASQKKLGGGVILTCSHEIDLALYLFGGVESVNAFSIKNKLKIDVEDRVQIILRHLSGHLSEIFLDFGNKNLSRKIKVYNNNEILKWNFYKNFLTVTKKGKSKKIFCNYKNLDKIYECEIKDFLKYLNKDEDKCRISYINTINTQLTLNAINLSLKKKKQVFIRKNLRR